MKRFITLLLMLGILLSCTSCLSIDTARSNSDISIYLFEQDTATRQSVEKFNLGRQKGKINIQTVAAERIEDYQNALLSDLSNGKGPDIIMLYPSYIDSLAQYLNLDVFYDLNALIKDDKAFKLDDYADRVIDCGVKDGKRYLFPLAYTVEALFSTEEILKTHNLSIDKRVLSLEDMLALSKSFKEAQNGDMFINALPSMGYINHFVDPLTQTASFDNEEFKMFMEQYQALHQSVTVVAENSWDLSLLPQGRVALLNLPIYGVHSTLLPYQLYDKAVSDPVLLSYSPWGQEGNAIATPSVLVAVNKNCANKEAAFEFIKTLLSTDAQMERGQIDGIPVNWEAYEEIKEDSSNRISASTGGIRDEEALRRLTTQLDEIIKGDLICRIQDPGVGNIISKELMNYLAGSKTKEAASKDMQDRVNSYFKGIPSPEQTPTPTPAAPRNVTNLTLHYMEDQLFVKNAIRYFNDSHTDVQIKGTMHSSKDIENFKTMLTTSVMAGEGPDLLVYRPNLFNSLTKTMATGAFADLNPLIEGDPSFDTSAFYPEVFNAGVFNDKRYFIPLYYEISTLVTSKTSLSSLALTLDEAGWTMNELKDAIHNYKASNPSGSQYFFDHYMNFLSLLRSSGLQLVDYQNKTTSFQSKGFIELMVLYKEIAPLVPSLDTELSLGLTPVLLRDNVVRMIYLDPQKPSYLARNNAIATSYLGDDFVIVPFPTYEAGAKYPVRLFDVVSINAQCQDQQAAFDFIKILLSEEIQKTKTSHGFYNDTSGMPVNRYAYLNEIEELKAPSNNVGLIAVSNGVETTSVKSIPLTDEVADMAMGIINHMAPPIHLDQEIENIISEGLQAYLSGKRTAEQAAKEIDEKVSLFLNE
jgi:ABC-type glycerol-3-phosphate transport system substrate-binding protein